MGLVMRTMQYRRHNGEDMHRQSDTGFVGHDIHATIRRHIIFIIFGRLEPGARLRLERMPAGSTRPTARRSGQHLIRSRAAAIRRQ